MIDFSLIPVAYAGVITDAPSVSSVLMKALQWLLSIVGIVAVIAFVGCGLLYITAQGNETMLELAKTWMVYSLFGLIVAFGSLVVLSTIGGLF